MDNRPIGVFDSGLGGLTTVKCLIEEMPKESIIYFGDTGRVPYGTRSNETIIKYVHEDIRFLMKFDIKAIIVACGTASAVALDAVKDCYEIPVIEVVEPAVKAAAGISLAKGGKKRIGVIGTSATINSRAYERKIHMIDPSIDVLAKACPLFVPLVENGYSDRGNKVAQIVAMEYLEQFIEYSPDAFILGCTHYPLLKDIISDILKGVNLVDPGAQAACYAKKLLSKTDLLSDGNNPPEYKYFVSDSVSNFERLASEFLEKDITAKVEKVEIM